MRYVVLIIWIAIGAFWAVSPAGKKIIERICFGLSPLGRKVAAPIGLAVAAIIAILSFFVLTQRFALGPEGLTVAGFVVATLMGSCFVSIQVISAMVTLRGLEMKPETVRQSPASNTEDHDA